MVTNPTPTTISTPPPGGGSGFTMDESAMDTLQHQADDLRTGYQEVSSALSGQTLAGNAFGTAGTFAAEAFNASTRRSVELAGKAASTLGLVGDGLKATAQTHLEADRAGVEQFTMVDPAAIADAPQGAPAGGPNGTPTTQGPPVTPTQDIPGGSTGGGGGGGGGNPSQPPVTATQDIPGANGTTQASNYTGPETSAGQAGVPAGQGGVPSGQAGVPAGQAGGAPTGQPGGTPTGQMPPMPGVPATPGGSPTMPSAPAGTPTGSGSGSGSSGGGGGGGGSAEETKAAAARTSTPAPQAATPTPAPIPDFPEIPDPPPVPNGSGGGGGANLADALKTTPTTGGESASGTKTPTGGTTPSANTTPPPTPPIPEVPKDLFKQPTIPDLGTGSGTSGGTGSGTGSGSGTGTGGGSTGGSSPSTPGATTPSGGMTPPPMPPIPEVPKDLFKQPTIPDLGTGGGTGTSGGSPSGDTPKPTAPPLPDTSDLRPGEQSPGDQGGRGDRDEGDHKGGDREGRDREASDREGRDQEGRDREGGEHGGGGGGAGDGGENDARTERDQHGFPITSVDGKPCLDLRDLPAEEGERWQEKIRDIIATKGEGSFFWAGDTIDAEGQRHSLMDLAEFMTNLDSRTEPTGPQEQPERQVSDTVATSPARSADGDVFVLVGPNRAEDDPVELTDFPTLQANPRVERVFAIDAVTGRETQIHPKVS